MKLCLFSTYSKVNKLENYVKFYIENLLPHFDKIILLTNDDRKLEDSDISFIDRLGNVELKYVKNEGFDFGMWYKYIKEIKDINKIDLLGLVNDSCILFRNLNTFFDWLYNNVDDLCSITDSKQYDHHLQSYFLMCKRPAINSLYNFFMDSEKIINGTDVRETIFNCEIGLSKYLCEKGFNISAIYKSDNYRKINTSLMSAIELINNGCPMIKKKLINKSFRDHESKFLISNGFDFSVNYENIIRKVSYSIDDNVNINYLLNK